MMNLWWSLDALCVWGGKFHSSLPCLRWMMCLFHFTPELLRSPIYQKTRSHSHFHSQFILLWNYVIMLPCTSSMCVSYLIMTYFTLSCKMIRTHDVLITISHKCEWKAFHYVSNDDIYAVFLFFCFFFCVFSLHVVSFRCDVYRTLLDI